MYKGLHALVIGGLIGFITNILKYTSTDGTSCPGNRQIKYFQKCYFRIFYYKEVVSRRGETGRNYTESRYGEIPVNVQVNRV